MTIELNVHELNLVINALQDKYFLLMQTGNIDMAEWYDEVACKLEEYLG